jgi:GTP cyclohydrolase I
MELLQQANSNIPRTEEEKEKMIQQAAVHYGNFLKALGFDFEMDENSKETPRRVAKSWVNDLIRGCVTKAPKITAFPANGYDGIVFQGNIKVISLCSHHNLAFRGTAHVAYIPGTKVIGLSKLNRIVDWFSRRPQLQEALTMQVHEYVNEICEQNKGVAILIEANHTCCSNRGISHDSTMKTAKLSGTFLDNNDKSRDEFYNFIADLKRK